MAFEVQLSERARRDFENACLYIADPCTEEREALARVRTRRFRRSQVSPVHWVKPPESRDTEVEIRQMHVGSSRILYTIRDDVTCVPTIHRAAVRFLPRDEWSRLTDDA